jgi:hypothetical protein
MLRDSAMMFPAFLTQYRSDRWFSREELRAIAYLGAWAELLDESRSPESSVTILDHGPVFRLATLREFGPAVAQSAAFERWWRQASQRWRRILDAVVWLDAPDDLLVQRIRFREKDHIVKKCEDAEARRFLGRYRTGLESVLQGLMQGRLARVLRLSGDASEVAGTGREAPEARL